MVTTAAPEIPDIAAKIVQIATVPMASPPRSPPHQRCIIRYRSCATPLRSSSIAMKT